MLFQKSDFKEVMTSSCYVNIRALTPFDQILVQQMLGESRKDELKLEYAMTLMSIVSILKPTDEALQNGTYRMLDPVNPHNYVEIWDTENNLDSEGKATVKKKILDPDFPDNWIIDKNQCELIKFDKPIDEKKGIEQLYERMIVTSKDWLIISKNCFLLNEPNPYLLGK